MDEVIDAPCATAPQLRFGRFTVIDEAGVGAMGVVYSAYDPALDRRVALKILRGGAHRERAWERLRREALALARVNHPNVVPIYEVGEADGRAFIAMEFVEGDDLAAWLADGRDWRAVLTMFAEVGRGLAAAHGQGLVHRDFKPSNVLVGADGRPRLIDFGLARAAAELDRETALAAPTIEADLLSSPLTQTGHLMGTPAYMAPEVLDGGAPTPASDQFSFCVALFEALCGAPPFPRESLAMLRYAISRGNIAVPERVAAPSEVLALVCRGLAETPEARWPSVAALLDALEAVDAYRPDVKKGLRVRVAIASLGLLLLGGMTAKAALDGPPRDAGEVVQGELAIAAGLGVILSAFRRWFSAEALNRRLRTWLVLFVGTKLMTALVGARLNLSVDQLFAIDTSVMVGLLAFTQPYIGLRPNLGLGAVGAALVAIFVAPAHTVVLHHGAGLLMLLGFLHSKWVLRRA